MVDLGRRVLGVILAGGASRRFGTDKALATLVGIPLIQHVARWAYPQVDALAVSRGADQPLPLDLPLIPDREAGQGPLSGIVSSLQWGEANGFALLATFPCDGPLFPYDLVARLRAGLTGFDCAMAASGAERHYTYGLWRTENLPRVEKAFAGGQRSLRGLTEILSLNYVDFGPDAFININHPANLAAAESRLAQDKPRR